jgi:hypothetical protein
LALLKKVFLTLFRMVVKKCIAVWLEVIYDSQATNGKQGGLPVKIPIPTGALLLVAWESYMTPSRPAQKYHQKQMDALTF